MAVTGKKLTAAQKHVENLAHKIGAIDIVGITRQAQESGGWLPKDQATIDVLKAIFGQSSP
jgi:electron transfer flavoprotein alpha subunit